MDEEYKVIRIDLESDATTPEYISWYIEWEKQEEKKRIRKINELIEKEI